LLGNLKVLILGLLYYDFIRLQQRGLGQRPVMVDTLLGDIRLTQQVLVKGWRLGLVQVEVWLVARAFQFQGFPPAHTLFVDDFDGLIFAILGLGETTTQHR
jgi:hypothetical protein